MTRNRGAVLSLAVLFALPLAGRSGGAEGPIRLLVRGDDIGSSHAANVACIESYRRGIVRSVEVMVPCAWFPEAVKMLREHPDLDVGVHLTLTSEWEGVKWRPLTHAPSLVDEDGYFFPMIWPNDRFPPERTLRGQEWRLEEIERELRAQIELARRRIPQVSHLSHHMGCNSWDPRVKELCDRLAKEYGLHIDSRALGVERFPVRGKGKTLEERLDAFLTAIGRMEPGKTYLFVEHPGTDSPELRATGHDGYYGVASDRHLVTEVFTSDRVKAALRARGVELISYRDLAASRKHAPGAGG